MTLKFDKIERKYRFQRECGLYYRSADLIRSADFDFQMRVIGTYAADKASLKISLNHYNY